MDELAELLEQDELTNVDKAIEYMVKSQKPLIICSIFNEYLRTSRTLKKLQGNGLLMYPTPERAAKVLAHIVDYSQSLGICK